MSRLACRLAVLLAVGPWLAACSHGTRSDTSEPAGAPPTAAPGAVAAAPERSLLGQWCMQSQSLGSTDERIPDGSKWDFAADGSYSYAHKWHRQRGTWRLNGNTLEISEVGAHEVVELAANRMVLKRISYQYFGRNCGPEYAKAEQVQRLVAAAAAGSVPRVEHELNAGADIDGVDYLTVVEQTALMAAARDGHVAVVELLLSRGAKPDRMLGGGGDTALAIAERVGHKTVVTALLRGGARPHVRPSEDEAAEVGEPEPAARADRGMARAALDPSKLDPGALSAPSTHANERPAAIEGPAANKLPAAAERPAADEPPVAARRPPGAAAPDPGGIDPATMLKEACAYRKETMQKALRGEMDDLVNTLRVSREEYVARQQEIYDRECR